VERTWYWKLGLVLALFVAAGAQVWANFESAPPWVRRTFDGRMQLGLDLQGGARLAYEVKVEDAIRDRTDRIAEDLKERLARELRIHRGEKRPDAKALERLSKRVRVKRGGEQDIWLTFDRGADASKVSQRFLRSYGILTEVGRSGNRVHLRLDDSELQYLRDTAVEQAVEVISNRINETGIKETGVAAHGEDVVVEIPGVREEEFGRVKALISQTARLEFKICDDENPWLRTAAQELPDGIELMEESVSTGPGRTGRVPYLKATGADARGSLRRYVESLEVPEDRQLAIGEESDQDTLGNVSAGTYWRTYLLVDRSDVSGEFIDNAQVSVDQRDNTPYVALSFNGVGAQRFEEVTGANVKKRMAIVLDDRVASAPVIQARIPGGNAQITLGSYRGFNETMEEARDLVVVLRAGALPAPIVPITENRIGPTLGKDGIRQGVKALIVGVIGVFLFMLVYYRLGGAVADVGVLLNLTFVIGIMSMLGATLTLPGIAGLALTVGMAVDANVIINERIREEMRLGKSPRAAVDAGYARAFWAIFDSNVTTVIAGIVLLQYGTGPIKGFAVTLIVGILCNLFTGVFCTRIFMDWLTRGLRVERLNV